MQAVVQLKMPALSNSKIYWLGDSAICKFFADLIVAISCARQETQARGVLRDRNL